MSSIKKIAIVLILLFAVLYIATLFISGEYKVEREITINKPIKEVFDFVKMTKNQYGFGDWFASDSLLEKKFKGIDGTEGFWISWENKKTNTKGEEEILKLIENKSIDFEIRFIEPIESKTHSYMEVNKISETTTQLMWGLEGKIPYPANVLLLFTDYGKTMEVGLEEIKSIIENPKE